MINPNEYEYREADRAELQRQAEQAQLSKDIRKTQPIYAPLLAKVGDVMVEAGSNLRDRYGELVEETQSFNPKQVTS